MRGKDYENVYRRKKTGPKPKPKSTGCICKTFSLYREDIARLDFICQYFERSPSQILREAIKHEYDCCLEIAKERAHGENLDK